MVAATSTDRWVFVEGLVLAGGGGEHSSRGAGPGMIEVECLLIFNDASLDAVELLKGHVAPIQADIAETCPKLHLRVEYLNEFFESPIPRSGPP